MQLLNNYGLHIADTANIAHYLKFENFNDPIPTSFSDLFTNPVHSVTLIILGILMLNLCYKLYILYCEKIHAKLQLAFPTSIAVHIPSVPSVPPQYVHNQPNSMGIINILLQ